MTLHSRTSHTQATDSADTAKCRTARQRSIGIALKAGYGATYALLALLCLLLLPLLGCGVMTSQPNTPGQANSAGTATPTASLSLSVSTLTLLSAQSEPLSITTKGVSLSAVSLTVSCAATQCGSVDNKSYTAPKVSINTAVTITASVAQPAPYRTAITVTVLPTVLPVPIAPGTVPTYPVSSFGASGSSSTYTCSGVAGSRTLTCDQSTTDFTPTQGVRVVGGGIGAQTPSPADVTVSVSSTTADAAHSYCYRGADADPLDGISTLSQQVCVEGPASLSLQSANLISWQYSGPQADALWYVSVDGGTYRFLCSGCNADVGQRPASAMGWPAILPTNNDDLTKNEDLFTSCESAAGNHIVLATPLLTTVVNAVVDHDDSASVQAALTLAGASGGGRVQFGSGSYNIRRPSWVYVQNNSVAYPNYTTTYAMAPWWAGYSLLVLPNGSKGNVSLEGLGQNTTIVTPPGHAGIGSLIAIGGFGRPSFAPYTALSMEEVAKGALSITVNSGSEAGGLKPGDDIWLFSGDYSYQTEACGANDGTAGGMCHYSELNTVTAVDGNSITLMYPTSKRYYSDGTSSFGLVKMPVTPHNVAVEHMAITTYDPITPTGLVYGLIFNDLHISGPISHGPFGGGFKRDVLIENSSWTFGAGDMSWQATDEYDQFTNLAFVNNDITGYAAPGSEGPSLMARIYMTEGSSQVLFQQNTFHNASVYFQETTDDDITGNIFTDGVLSIGSAYSPTRVDFVEGVLQDAGYISFDSQEYLNIYGNTFNIDASFQPPYVLNVGHYSAAVISNNAITYNSTASIPIIVTRGGTLSGNVLTIGSSTGSVGVVGLADQGPGIAASSFQIQRNTITGGHLLAGIAVPDPGFKDAAPVCLENDNVSSNVSIQLNLAAADVTFGCD